MKRAHIISGILAIGVVLLVCFLAFSKGQVLNLVEITATPPISQAPSSGPSPLPSATTSPTASQVNIYLVAIDDAGKSGEKIGCDDSIVPVPISIHATTPPLTAALNHLLSLKMQQYGQSGLYNALYQSQLSVQKVSLSEGTATVYLTGNLVLGGVCDNPRVESQLNKTALQFPSVQKVHFFINNKPLAEVLSEK